MPRKTDTGTRTERVKRHAKVLSAVGGLSFRVAGEKFLGIDIDRPEHARQLMARLGGLKGPLLKIGQLLATVPGALPEEYATQMQKLQSQAPPMGWPFVRRRMRTELGAAWEKKFKSFDKTAAAAASLGQVHRAETQDGAAVACKLQYPDMESAVEADLQQLNVFLALFEKIDPSFATGEIQKEIADRLREELDYDREARHTRLFGLMLKDEAGVHVPRVIDDLSTDRLLTATWLEGEPVLTLTRAKQDRRDRVAENLFRAWYAPLYSYGVLHGDPHPGNYTVRADDTLNLLDFGCVRVFPPSFVEGVMMLYRALQEGRDDMAVAAYEGWGFVHLNKKTVEILNVWARFLYGPLLDDRVRMIGTVPEKGIYGHETARKVHAELKKSGGVAVPRPFVFMDRAALGLGSVFLRLGAKANWHRLFNEMTEDFNVKTLETRQTTILKDSGFF